MFAPCLSIKRNHWRIDAAESSTPKYFLRRKMDVLGFLNTLSQISSNYFTCIKIDVRKSCQMCIEQDYFICISQSRSLPATNTKIKQQNYGKGLRTSEELAVRQNLA
ncbi:PREDICTED: uncharacterized protein LOC108549552 [Eufriesea mexicana]|uniref:uncharacterized protein LOC108549552 n=1 Tax=Eufriesea mexicana TaxID=516756 RepID=UPI00083BF94D|nr:PREDICTED: uncharacterized protein LOC108549552 [Eufriesea mexicana]